MKTAFVNLDHKKEIATWLKSAATATADLEPVFLHGSDCFSALADFRRVIFTLRCDEVLSLARPGGCSIIDQLPVPVISRLKKGNSSLLLDNSFERLVSRRDVFLEFHKSIKNHELDPSSIVIASPCWNLGEEYRRLLGLPLNEAPHFVFLHAFLNSLTNIIRKSSLNRNGLTERQEMSLLHVASQDHLRILCLNNIVKPHRLANALYLFANFPAGSLRLSFADVRAGQENLSNLVACVNHIGSHLKPFDKLLSHLPAFQERTPYIQDKIVGSVAARENSVIYTGDQLGIDCNLEIVTESEFSNYSLMRVSEKAFKPLLRGIPFMILGNPNSHKFLSALGFASYEPIINHHAYDCTESPAERLANFFSQLERTNRLVELYGSRAMKQLLDRIKFNAKRANIFLPALCDQSLTHLIGTIVDRADSKKSRMQDPVLSLISPNNKYSYAIPLVVVPKDARSVSRNCLSMVRLLGHLPSSGGSPISHAIAAMPDVVLLSEIHPYASDRLTFSPMRQYLQYYADSEFRDWVSSPSISSSLTFRNSIKLIAADCERKNKLLVIRDWAFLDFIAKSSKPLMYSSVAASELSEIFLLRYCATIRHPVDTWLSFLNSGFSPNLSLDSFSTGYLRFAEYILTGDWFKYEDFCGNSDRTLRSICESLDIEFSPDYQERMQAVRHITGNSGRRSLAIKARERRKATNPQEDEMMNNVDMIAAINLLGYGAMK